MTESSKHVTAKMLHAALLRDVMYVLGDNVTCNTLLDLDLLYERVATRGLTLIMDDLPKLGKLYDRALDSGGIQWNDVPASLRVKGKRSKQGRTLFASLLGLSFEPSGRLHSGFEDNEDSPDIVMATRSFLYLHKKVKEESSDKAKLAAAQEFLALDLEVETPNPWWSFRSDDCGGGFASRIDYQTFQPSAVRRVLQLMDRVAAFLVPREFISWEQHKPRHGPGSVSDLRRGDDKYHFPSWPKCLSSVFPSNGWASHVHSCAEESLPTSWGSDPRSKLICVPKTLSKPRVIASEPTAMQYCQQAVKHALYHHMSQVAKSMISVKNQEYSRMMALAGSLTGSGEGGLGTVDLSSASDLLSCNVVSNMFRSNIQILEALRATRTPQCDVNGEIVDLNKFAAMGSACTFPVQSLVYACAALSVVLHEEGVKPEDHITDQLLLKVIGTGRDKCIQVYGDDIIVPHKCVVNLTLVLETLGFKINSDKTFYRGFFRESCGMDAYRGVEVTPLYVRELGKVGEAEVATVVETANNAYLKGFWYLADAMRRQIPKSLNRYIPVSSLPLPSLRYVAFQEGIVYFSKKEKYNNRLQHQMVKGFVVRAKRRVAYRNDWYDLLQWFIEGSRDSHESLDYMDPVMSMTGHAGRNRISYGIRWVRKLCV